VRKSVHAVWAVSHLPVACPHTPSSHPPETPATAKRHWSDCICRSGRCRGRRLGGFGGAHAEHQKRGTVWAAGGSVCACMLQGTYLCMSNGVHVILLANSCSPALSGLEIDISRRHCVETCTEGPQLRGEPKSPCAAAPLPSIFPWTTSLKPAVRRPEHDRAPCPNVPAFRNTPHETLAKPCLLGPPGHPCRVVPCTSTAQDQSQGCRRRLRGALALTRE